MPPEIAAYRRPFPPANETRPLYLADIAYTHLELLFRPSFSLSEKEVVTLSTEGIVGDIFCSLTDSVSYQDEILSWHLNYALLTEERSRIGFVTFSLTCDVVRPTFIGQFCRVATSANKKLRHCRLISYWSDLRSISVLNLSKIFHYFRNLDVYRSLFEYHVAFGRLND